MEKEFTRRARRLRRRSTDVERSFWIRVRNTRLAGFKFKRQQPIGPYIVDFLCVEARLVIELDGGQHDANESDRYRDARLRSYGYRVLRFWNSDVLTNVEGVLETIVKALESPSP